MWSWRAVGLAVTACVVAVALLPVDRGEGPDDEAGVAARPAGAGQPVGGPARSRSSAGAEVRRAVAVLRDWDERRAAAWAAGRRQALRDLYPAGSAAGAADVRLLGRWSEAGWRVERLTTQLLAVRVRRASARRLELLVVDRVAGGRVVSATGAVRPLPTTSPAVRRLTLQRSAGVWRLSGSAPGPPARRP